MPFDRGLPGDGFCGEGGGEKEDWGGKKVVIVVMVVGCDGCGLWLLWLLQMLLEIKYIQSEIHNFITYVENHWRT